MIAISLFTPVCDYLVATITFYRCLLTAGVNKTPVAAGEGCAQSALVLHNGERYEFCLAILKPGRDTA